VGKFVTIGAASDRGCCEGVDRKSGAILASNVLGCCELASIPGHFVQSGRGRFGRWLLGDRLGSARGRWLGSGCIVAATGSEVAESTASGRKGDPPE
jgi:hypothetical protein